MLIWGVIVLVGVAILLWKSRPANPDVTAAVALPMNTLIGGDIVQTGFTGRYVIVPAGIKQGDRIKPDDVGDRPVPLGAPPLRWLMVVPVEDGGASGEPTVGSKLQLCGSRPDALASATVVYVSCRASLTACSATVEVPLTEAAKVSAAIDITSIQSWRLAASCQP
jgi:hypothetical protein